MKVVVLLVVYLLGCGVHSTPVNDVEKHAQLMNCCCLCEHPCCPRPRRHDDLDTLPKALAKIVREKGPISELLSEISDALTAAQKIQTLSDNSSPNPQLLKVLSEFANVTTDKNDCLTICFKMNKPSGTATPSLAKSADTADTASLAIQKLKSLENKLDQIREKQKVAVAKMKAAISNSDSNKYQIIAKEAQSIKPNGLNLSKINAQSQELERELFSVKDALRRVDTVKRLERGEDIVPEGQTRKMEKDSPKKEDNNEPHVQIPVHGNVLVDAEKKDPE